jgi:hypothetical protein
MLQIIISEPSEHATNLIMDSFFQVGTAHSVPGLPRYRGF